MRAAKRHCYSTESQADVYENGFKNGFQHAIELLQDPRAAHEYVENGKIVYLGAEHIGPSLMSAALWGSYLKRILTRK